MNEQTTINWNKAIQEKKEKDLQKEKDLKAYNKRVTIAHDELWDKLGEKDFCISDFEDTCFDNDIDQDDLFHSLI